MAGKQTATLRDPYDYPFVAVPRALLDLRDAMLVAIYYALKHHAQARVVAFPGYDTLAEELGLGRMTIIRHMKRLEEAGFVHVERKVGKPNIYTLRPHGLSDPCQPDTSIIEEPVPQGDGTSTNLIRVPVPQRYPKENSSKEKNEGDTTTASPESQDYHAMRSMVVDLFFPGGAYDQARVTRVTKKFLELGARAHNLKNRYERAKKQFAGYVRSPETLLKYWDTFSEEAVASVSGGTRNPQTIPNDEAYWKDV